MKRRAKESEEQARRVAEASDRDGAAAREQEEREAARLLHGARLKEWAEESSGSRKGVRVLLASMHTVLWPDAKWEPVPMAKLIEPKRVKLAYMRACTLVHPDKHNHMDGAQRFIATEIFHYVESAYSLFREAELGGA